MEIPRLITNRDPRKQVHIREAFGILEELGGLHATERTVKELRRLNIKLPKKTKVWKRIGKHDVVIGGFFFLDHGLHFPDNVLITCSVCRAALQIRPQTNTAAEKLCVFCAVDRRLQEYWTDRR
jgi:hypothetical protein